MAQLRSLLGVTRISMPAADAARAVTGYERGTITRSARRPRCPSSPTSASWPDRLLGAGAHGVAATLAADDVIAHLGAQVADVTDPA